MRVSQDEKDRSHARIVESAARLIRERGPEATGVAEVMTGAGLTHGGFYRHFDSKEALLTAALDAAFDDMMALLAKAEKGDAPGVTLAGVEAFYLGDRHVAGAGTGCPVAALASELARGPAALRASFSAGVNRMIARLARGVTGSAGRRRDTAIRKLAMMAGAVMIARASDPATAQAVLAACRMGAPGRAGVPGSPPASGTGRR